MADETQPDETTVYPSHARAGLVTVEIPYMDNIGDEGMYSRSDMRPLGAKLPGACEKIQACNFGNHVKTQVSHAFKYRGPKAASALLSHYAEHGKQTLLDACGARQMRALADNMPKSSDPEKYFRESVEPFLTGLTPHAR
jgi:hypothetical protein